MGENEASLNFEATKSYTCLIVEQNLKCLDEEAYQVYQAGLEEDQTPVTKKKSSKTTKKTSPQPSGDLRNEAEVTITGPGTITVASDIASKIYIDGKLYRKSPLFKQEIKSGTHNIVISPESDPSRRKKFTVEVKSGVGYMFKWSFEEGRWLQKSP